jgi:Na+:H+ antiporter, NhaA family
MYATPDQLFPPVDLERDHVPGPPDAEMTLVEYGSHACSRCRVVHEVVEQLRNIFEDRMRYVFRHLPIAGSDAAVRPAELAEAAEANGRFWEVHETLMERELALADGDLQQIFLQLGLPPVARHDPCSARHRRACGTMSRAPGSAA